MDFLLSILINMLALILAASIMKNVSIKNWGTALLIALLIGILNPTVGWLLRGVFNILTLGLFWVLGLGFIIRWIVTAIIIRMVDSFLKGFKTKSFGTALLLALFMAIFGTVIGWLL